MSGQQLTRRVYSAEELHRLRASCSQPKLREAIEEHDGEDAELVKEHVLRGSRSFAARSFRSRTSGNSLRVPSNKENRSTADADSSRHSSDQDATAATSVLGEIAPNGQILRSGISKVGPSPTPSLKKKKAEAIVKAHGSPQHVRVTAGGRIVPSEQSPLCHPRYGYSAIKNNGGLIKFAPNHPMGKAQWTQATQNGFVAQDVNGRLCQIVNGTILPLNEIDGALRLYVPAPNLNITSRTSSITQNGQGRFSSSGTRRTLSQGKLTGPPDPPLPAQTNALELEYSKLELELKDLDKTEVLHGRTMGKAAKEALVAKRRELVITLDNIRKAIKSIKSIPAADLPHSPHAPPTQPSVSPVKSRLPAFLQQRPQQDEVNMPPMSMPYGPYFGMSQMQQYPGQCGFPSAPSPDALYPNAAMGMAQPPLFVPPPPFDGSVAPPFGPYQDSTAANIAGTHAMPQNAGISSATANIEGHLPQTDGASSFADLRKPTSPGRSYAVDIKAPESKSVWSTKSNLNPMSPAYKPVTGVLQNSDSVGNQSTKSAEDHAPTSVAPLHPLKPVSLPSKGSNTTEDTISPTKKSPHLHSSSVSSFETADFFPRNTREYSTRKYAYPEPVEQNEDKENVSPGQPTQDAKASLDSGRRSDEVSHSSNAGSGSSKSATVPQGAQKGQHDGGNLPTSDRGTSDFNNPAFDVSALPDRQANNLSPKGRRQEYLFVPEDPRNLPSLPSSSPEKYQSCYEEPRTNSSSAENIDFSEASRDWIEGYRAGLARKAVESDRAGEFLDGYCAGLLKSKPTKVTPSTGSPIKGASRRPSPAVIQSRSSSRLHQLDQNDFAPNQSPFENSMHSMDTLKEAVFAPQNEDAILTPAAEGPHVSEAPLNLGTWAKNRDLAAADILAFTPGDGLAGFPFPHRTASMIKRQGVMSEDDAVFLQHFHQQSNPSDSSSRPASMVSELSSNVAQLPTASPVGDMRGINLGLPKNTGNRIGSLTSIDSNIYCQWPGPRVFSNQLQWKSASSIAQAAGLASGFFANVQSDENPQIQRGNAIMDNVAMRNHSRFKETSLDGLTNPPNSPRFPSPAMSPALTGKDPGDSDTKDKKRPSPSKGNSPAKVRFENLAEKVGIKVSSGSKKEDGGSPNSPPGKRRWRDVWRGGAARKELSKDDAVPFHLERSG